MSDRTTPAQADPQVIALQRQMSPLQRTVSALSALAAVNPTSPVEGMIPREAQEAAAQSQRQARTERFDPLGTIEEGRGRSEERKEGKAGRGADRSWSEHKGKERKHGKGLTEGDEEMEAIPKNNLWLVVPAINLVAFVAALDQTILAAALPVIARDLDATPAQYSWVGTSYLLAQSVMCPINGRLTDIIGRKPMLYASVGMLTIFSAVCGAAQSIEMRVSGLRIWLIVARAFAGLGGGSFTSLSMIVISDICPLEKRALFQGYMSMAWALSSVCGPIIGGVLTEKASWRWCFYMNIPICGVSLVGLFLTLKLNKPKKHSMAELRRTFDFLGLLGAMVGTALVVLGFANAADYGFGVPISYAILVAGVAVFIAVIIHCLTTKKNAVIPARMLKLRTTNFFLIASFFNSFLFFPTVYILPQFFQGVKGANVLSSGYLMIPWMVSTAIVSMLSGYITSRLHIVRPIVWLGLAIGSLGYGLCYAEFRPHTSLVVIGVVEVITGGGAGFCFSATMLVIQAAMPMREMAAATSAWILVRSLAATIGLAVLQASLNAGTRARFASIPGYGTLFQAPEGREGYSSIQALPEGELKQRVLEALADSFRVCFLIGCGALAFSFLLTLWTRSYSITRMQGVKAPAADPADTSIEGSAPAPAEPPMETPGEKTLYGAETPLDKLDAPDSPIGFRSAGGQTQTTLVDMDEAGARDAERDSRGGKERQVVVPMLTPGLDRQPTRQ